MKKSILLFGAPGISGAIEDMTKAQVKGYTRSDGTYVQEHQDSRQAAQKPTPHLGANAKALRASSNEDDMDHWTNQNAADLMESGDHEALKHHLRNKDTAARDHVLDHIHPDHWEKLGFQPLDKERSVKKYEAKFGSKPKAKPAAKKSAPKKQAASGHGDINTMLQEGARLHKEAWDKDSPDAHRKARDHLNKIAKHYEDKGDMENLTKYALAAAKHDKLSRE